MCGISSIVVAVVLLASCASQEGGRDDGGTNATNTDGAVESVIKAGWVNESQASPTTGGTLNVTLASKPPGLDPTSGTLSVSTQGPLYFALYDSLMQYDPDTGGMSGRLAEGMTHNADFTEWTINLRPDITFTDGTKLDAQAVLFNINRAKSAKNPSAAFPAFFSSVEATDELTVVLKLDTPMNNVDALFAAELGFIVSPAAVQAAGDSFTSKPVGAGPFMVQSYNQDTDVTLVKNPSFALGDVALDQIRMTWSADAGTNIDKVATGQSDVSFFANSPTNTAKAIKDGLPTYTTLVGGSGIGLNNAAGRPFPGDDPRIRQAISMAIDPQLVNERAFDGQGVVGRFLLPPGNRFHVDTPFSVGDAAQARSLVEAVKSETGWDGSLTIDTAPPEDQAQAWAAQLNAAGFQAQVDVSPGFTGLIDKVIVKKDFDLAAWILTTYDTNIYLALTGVGDTGPDYFSVRSPQLNELLVQLRSAPNDEAFKSVLSDLARQFQEEQPFFFTGTSPFSTITTTKVGGLVVTANGCFLWDKVFKA